MKKSDAVFLLKERILLQEVQLMAEKGLLKTQLNLTLEGFKPFNLIKNAFLSPAFKTKALDAAIGITAGFIAKKVVVRSSHNPLLKITGSILQVGVMNLVSKNPEVINSILKIFFNPKETNI